MTYKKLGRISSIKLGTGGYDDAMFGVSVVLSFDGTGTTDFRGTWQTYPKGAEYTEQSWQQQHADAYTWLRDLMRAAKVSSFDKLNGTPIEAEIENMRLKSWRVLTEVL